MYCSPIDVFLAVKNRFAALNRSVAPQHLICLGILCDCRNACRAIPQFIVGCHDPILECVCSSDNQLSSAALLTAIKAVECYRLFSSADDVRYLVPLLGQFIQERPSLASTAVACLMTILDNCDLDSPAYPLDQRFAHVDELWSIVTVVVQDAAVVIPAFLIFEHFIADLPDSHLAILNDFHERSIQLFIGTPVCDDPTNDLNCAVRGCCLDLITDIFRASRGSLYNEATAAIEFSLSQIESERLSPIGDFLTVILAASEQLLIGTAPFLDRLFPLLLTVIEQNEPTTLEPAFELMSFLCQLFPVQMMQRSQAIAECLVRSLDSESFPSATHPGSLRALASLFAAIPLAFAPPVHEWFRRVCMTACASVFGLRALADEDEDLQDIIALAEAIILGFTALIFMANGRTWLDVSLKEWAHVAEKLVMIRAPPVSEHLLEAYFSFLEASHDYSAYFDQLISMLNTVPISWGIGSDDAELRARALSLFDMIADCEAARP
jgi:hypothetical protein